LLVRPTARRISPGHSFADRILIVLIIAFKLLTTPFMISSASWAGRRWGPVVSGLLIGLPLTSGPISVLLACEYGSAFSAHAAVGSLAGQISNCLFCLAYTWAARRWGWLASVAVGIATFLLSTLVLKQVSWQLWPAFFSLLAVSLLASRLMPRYPASGERVVPPKWDLPVRMLIATSFVVTLTTLADRLGPALSGLIAPFPVLGLVFAAFTHLQQGAKMAANLLRGFVMSSFSFAVFFLVANAGVARLGIAPTYLLAAALAVSNSGAMYWLTGRQAR